MNQIIAIVDMFLFIPRKASRLFLGTRGRRSDEFLRDAHNAVKNGAIILDVRTPEEYREKHIENSINIPVHLIERRYEQIAKHKEIIVYCRRGNRSHAAAMRLLEKGHTVYDVATQKEWEREV